MTQAAIATLGDDYHTSTSTRAHKNNYFNIVHALCSPNNMRRVACAERRILQTAVQASPSPHIWKRSKVPWCVASQNTTKRKWERKALLKAGGEESKGKVFFLHLLTKLECWQLPLLVFVAWHHHNDHGESGTLHYKPFLSDTFDAPRIPRIGL